MLGVTKAMGAISESPEVLGKLIAAALVGTFAGIFFSYSVVAPIATKMKSVREKRMRLYVVVKQSLLAFMNGAIPQVAIEHGRKTISSAERQASTKWKLKQWWRSRCSIKGGMMQRPTSELTDEKLQRLVAALKPSTSGHPRRAMSRCANSLRASAELTPAFQSIAPAAECSLRAIRLAKFSSSQTTTSSLYVLCTSKRTERFYPVALCWCRRRLVADAGARRSASWRGGGCAKQTIYHRSTVGRIAIDLTLGTLARVLSAWSLDVGFMKCKVATEFEDLPQVQEDRGSTA